MSDAPKALVVRTDRIGFAGALTTQRALVEARRSGAIPDVLWLLEHDPVYTTGRHGARADLFLDDAALAARGASFAHADRGGLMTWHGPGQSVAYVICDLRGTRRVRPFVGALAEAMAEASGIPGAAADTSAMGAYVEGRKIGSVGIRVAGGISMHGLALNRDPDLAWFQAITACGAPDVVATSIAAEGGDPTRESVERRLVAALARRLGRALQESTLGGLLGAHEAPLGA
jgi:lipoyl(octanoyl) transferase